MMLTYAAISFYNHVIYIYVYTHTHTFFMPKTMDLFMLSRVDNKISITQTPQGFRWQEALFMEDI